MAKIMNYVALSFYTVAIIICGLLACGFAETLELWRLVVAILVGVPLTLIYKHYGIFKAIQDIMGNEEVEDYFN